MARAIAALLNADQARRDLRRFSGQLYRTETRALKLAGGNARRAYLSGLRRGRTQAMPAKIAPRNRAWQQILHPDRKTPQGGGLVQSRLWPIARTGAHAVRVDILAPYRASLARYQNGSDTEMTIRRVISWIKSQRGAVLNTGRMERFNPHGRGLGRAQRAILARISDWLYSRHPQTPDWRLMMHYPTYCGGAGIDDMRRDFSTVFGVDYLPRVTKQPPREVVPSIRRWVRAHLGEWYLATLAKIGTGKIKPGRLTRTGRGGLTWTA